MGNILACINNFESDRKTINENLSDDDFPAYIAVPSATTTRMECVGWRQRLVRKSECTQHTPNVSSAIHTLLFTHSDHSFSMRLNLTEIIRQSKYALHFFRWLWPHTASTFIRTFFYRVCVSIYFLSYHVWRWLMVIALINSFHISGIHWSCVWIFAFNIEQQLPKESNIVILGAFFPGISFHRVTRTSNQGKQNDITRRRPN